MSKRKLTLPELEARYDVMLKRPKPNLTTLRKLRDDIIKLRWELGLI